MEESMNLTTEDFASFSFQNVVKPKTSGCHQTSYELKYWVQYGLIPATAVILLFSFLQRRVRLWPNCCGMRPSVPSPVNLIDSYNDRWSFACAFAAMSTCVIMLFTGEWFYNPDISAIPSMFQGTILIFIALVNVLEISIAYYPLLLCLSTDHVLLGNTMGLVYTSIWSYYYVATLAACPREAGLEAQTITAVIGPVFICYLALLVRFSYGIYQALHKVFNPTEESESITALCMTVNGDTDDPFKRTHFYQRVKYLLSPPKPEGDDVSFTVRWRRKIIEDAPGFRFSRRAVCTFVLSALTTYQLGLVYVLAVSDLWESANRTLAVGGNLYNAFATINETDIFFDIKDFFNMAEASFWPTCYFAIATSTGYSLHMLICYRKHTLRLWRGNKDFCPRAESSFSSLVVANLRFSGYHIGFSVWGFFILQILSWVIVFFVVYFIIYPLRLGADTLLLEFLSDYWLSFVVGLVLYYLQVILSRLVFLQTDKEDKKTKIYLSLNNRRVYNVTVYITLFVNVILGLVSCLMRIVKAVVFGVLFIGRIDRSTLMRGWELWDPGFKAYIGFLQLEVAHTHPVVITFCHLLWKAIEKNKTTRSTSYQTFEVTDGVREDKAITNPSPSKIKSLCARNRWFVALTLMRNRALTISRVPVLPELQQVRVESRNATDTGAVKWKLPRLLSLQRRSYDSSCDVLKEDDPGEGEQVSSHPLRLVSPAPKTDCPSESDSLLADETKSNDETTRHTSDRPDEGPSVEAPGDDSIHDGSPVLSLSMDAPGNTDA